MRKVYKSLLADLASLSDFVVRNTRGMTIMRGILSRLSFPLSKYLISIKDFFYLV
jgi:hypothetical protein